MNVLAKIFGISGAAKADNTEVLDRLAEARKANAEEAAPSEELILGVWMPVSDKLNTIENGAKVYPAVWAVMDGTSVESLRLFDSGLDIGAWKSTKLYTPVTETPFVKIRTFLVTSGGVQQNALGMAFAQARAYLQSKSEIVALSKALESKADRQEAAIMAGNRDGVNGEDPVRFYTRHVFVRAIVRCGVRRAEYKTKEGLVRNSIELIVREFVSAPECAHPQNLPLEGNWFETALDKAVATQNGIVDAAAQHGVASVVEENVSGAM